MYEGQRDGRTIGLESGPVEGRLQEASVFGRASFALNPGRIKQRAVK